METQKGFMDKCLECGSTNLIYDYDTDETICGGCGLVIHEQMGLSTAIDRENLLTISKAREKIYTSRHAARLVGIHFRTFKRWIYNNIVSVSETPGGKYYVSESEICRLKKLLSNPRKKRFYSGKQASEIIGVGTLAIKRWISSGEMSAGRTPTGEYCIPVSEIDRFKRLVSSNRVSERLVSNRTFAEYLLTVSKVEDKIYTTGEAARLIGVSQVRLRYWIRSGKISFGITPGGWYCVRKSEIDRLKKLMSGELEKVLAKNDVFLCPFDGNECEFPDGEHFKSADFVGCKVVDYVYGNEVIRWVCPRFPMDMSITAVRDAFDRILRRSMSVSECDKADNL